MHICCPLELIKSGVRNHSRWKSSVIVIKIIMRINHKCEGTCSRGIEIEIEDGIVKNVVFDGGCHGNTQGIAALVKGMKAEDVIMRLEGIRCKTKPTSCPDQLARALKQAIATTDKG